MHFDETRRLLDELAEQDHPSAQPLRRAWALDIFLGSERSARDAAKTAGISEEELQAELRRRCLSQKLETSLPQAAVPEVSVVLPVFNEEQNIRELHRRLTDALADVAGYELIFVNNGSVDGSEAAIRELQRTDGHIRLMNLSRNFGHQGGITAGLDESRGQAVILMDADLQDPPEVLGEMIDKWRKGADVVYAVRQKRKDDIFRRGAYFAFYRVLKSFAEIDIPLDSGDFCLMDRAVVDKLKELPERSRFLRGLRAWLGFKQVPFYYERAARHAGTSKYRWRHMLRLALDGLVSFSSLPLRAASYAGLLASIAGAAFLVFAVASYFLGADVPHGWTSTVALILLVSGAQLMLLGVLGEYVSRIYDETKKRPMYILESVVEPESSAPQPEGEAR